MAVVVSFEDSYRKFGIAKLLQSIVMNRGCVLAGFRSTQRDLTVKLGRPVYWYHFFATLRVTLMLLLTLENRRRHCTIFSP